jgi:uncharacterized protein YwgA
MTDVLRDRASSSSRWDKLVLAILDLRPTGATSLQKLGLTVLSVMEGKTPGSYHPHHFGGFDDDVSESVDSLRSEGYVELVGGKTYRLTPAGQQLVENYLSDEESSRLKTISSSVIPLMRRLSDDEVVSVVYSLFPELAERSLIKHRVDTGPKRVKNVEVLEVAR